MTIVVFGSINMDLTTYAERLPRLGETLFGTSFNLAAGGKGANQAVGAARLGAAVAFVGRVGQDMFGPAARQALEQEGIDTAGLQTDPDHGTGLAVINVDRAADNAIVVISGANMALDQNDLDRAASQLARARLVLLQLEVPQAASQALAARARQRGVRVVLDPAPAQPLPDEFLANVDVLTPNEVEAASLVGFPVDTMSAAQAAADQLRARGPAAVIVKLGAQGAYCSSGEWSGQQPPFRVDSLDTVAAGDAFNAGLAVALAEGAGLQPAVRWGAAAGALATTRRGAIPAMPSRDEVLALLAERIKS
ncbi:MAG TPA: ribokinase [Anaerolineales bacterium]|jgi:ribokinase